LGVDSAIPGQPVGVLGLKTSNVVFLKIPEELAMTAVELYAAQAVLVVFLDKCPHAKSYEALPVKHAGWRFRRARRGPLDRGFKG